MKSFKTIISAGFLASALVLAGCGGGGSDDDMGTDVPTEMTPEQKAKAEAEEAKRKQKEAEDALAKEKERQAEEKANADAMAAQKDAKNLFDILAKMAEFVASDYASKPSKSELRSASDDDMMSVIVTGKTFKKEHSPNDDRIITVEDSATNTDADPNVEGTEFSVLGAKEHEAESENNTVFATDGTYHGVSGRYVCTPDGTSGPCKSTSSDSGLILSGGEWTFKANDVNQKVSDGKAVEFGWWAEEDDGKVTDVTFYHIPSGAYTTTAGARIPYTFNGGGSATYVGKAAGQYAVHQGAGARNDSGKFTADAELNADFSSATFAGDNPDTHDTISGTIDNFYGADGKKREGWSVQLREQLIVDSGNSAATPGSFTGLSEANAIDADSTLAMTVWSMGDSKAKADGWWTGGVYQKNSGDGTAAADTAPTAASGAFYAEYGNIGSMVGAFGAELDDN